MPSRSKSDLHPILVAAYDAAATEYAIKHPDLPQPFLTCTNRSNDEQEQLYAIGRTLPGRIVTKALPGQSAHNYKPAPAFDIAFIGLNKKLDWDKELFKKFADIIVAIEPKVEWGGLWKFVDRPHFQLFNWREYIT